MAKRLFDLGFTIAIAPIWIPLSLFVALLVRAKLGLPVIFRQERTGLNGRRFQLLKFRSMTEARDGDNRLRPDSERLTPFGRWLRSTSLDELPEFFHVLKGDMSLVGPRPLLPEYLPRYSPRQAKRHNVKPGLTGWSQVNGRNALSWPEKLELDVWYVEHQSLLLDIKILCRTVGEVLGRQGTAAPGSATAPEFTGSDAVLGENSEKPGRAQLK